MKRAATMLLALLAPGCEALTPAPPSPRAEILSVLGAQADAWNRGDLESFMSWYERSPRVSFSSASGTLRGWDAILARYRTRYGDRAAMGRLTFSKLEVTPLGPDHALVLGEFRLDREGGVLEGAYSLVFARGADGWTIVHDHTSSFPSTLERQGS